MFRTFLLETVLHHTATTAFTQPIEVFFVHAFLASLKAKGHGYDGILNSETVQACKADIMQS